MSQRIKIEIKCHWGGSWYETEVIVLRLSGPVIAIISAALTLASFFMFLYISFPNAMVSEMLVGYIQPGNCSHVFHHIVDQDLPSIQPE